MDLPSKRARLSGSPDTDLRIRLPNGEIVESYASIVSVGSHVIGAACELRDANETLNLKIDVCADGLRRALDEILPTYLKSSKSYPHFNPFIKSHRDFVKCLHYLCVPGYDATIADMPKESCLFGASRGELEGDVVNLREAFVFIDDHPGPLSSEVELAIARALFNSTSPITPSDKVLGSVMSRMVSDETAAAVVEKVGGRALANYLARMPRRTRGW